MNESTFAIRLPVSPDMLRGANGLPSNLTAPAIPQHELGKLAPLAPTALPPSQQSCRRLEVPAEILKARSAISWPESGRNKPAANDAVAGLATGAGVPLHQAVIAMEEASVSFQLMVEVRNKLWNRIKN